MSAIVFDPVPCEAAVGAVPASIESLLGVLSGYCRGDSMCPAPGRCQYRCVAWRASGARAELARLGELLGPTSLRFPQRALEECLVDLPLKDRHTELHALHDDFAAVHARLARELGGREVNRHWSVSLRRLLRLCA